MRERAKGRIRVNYPAWGPNIMIARDMGSQWAVERGGGAGLSTLSHSQRLGYLGLRDIMI